MRTKLILSMLILTAVAMTCRNNEAKAAFSAEVGTPNVNVRISDYQPAPPNVYVYTDGGRPYYVQRERRVYMEKKHHRKHHKKHYKDHGRRNGHNKHDH